MTWFYLALMAPLLWSVVNHIDKFLLSKYFKSGGVGALLIYSSLIALLVLPVVYAISPDVFDMAWQSMLTLLLVGILSALAVMFYLYAMNEDEASVVMPFFQTIPIYGMAMSYFFLGETLTSEQVAYSAVIVLGAVILSFDLSEDSGLIFKKKLVGFVLTSSFFYALYQVLFKVGALEEDFWVSLFWQHVGLLLVGLFLLAFVPRYRREFLSMVKDNSAAIFSLNIGSELLTIVGNSFVAYASLLAPVALVMTVELYQPAFVFLFGVLLTLYLPKIAKERIRGRHLVQKLSAIAVIFAGSYLLYFR